MQTLESLCAQCAVFLALLLAASGLHKIAGFARSRGVVERFVGMPSALAGPALAAAIGAEFTAALGLLLPERRAAGALLAVLVLAGYWLLIVRAILEGRRAVDCGCSLGPTTRPLGAFQVSRNAILLGMALAVLLASIRGATVPPEWSQVLGGIAWLALYGALDQVMALQPPRHGELI